LRAVPWVADPGSPVYAYFLRTAKAATPLLAIELVPGPIEKGTDIDRFLDCICCKNGH